MAKSSKANRMSVEQKVYALAKAAHETAKLNFDAICVERGAVYVEGMTDEQDEAIWERREDIAVELGLGELKDLLRAAEEAMVGWSLEHATKFSPVHAPLIAEVHARAKYSPKFWPQLVDIAFRLAA